MTKLNDIDTKIAVIALIRDGQVEPRMMEALLRHFGTVEMILASDAGTLMAIEGMTTEVANTIASASEFLDEAKIYYDLLVDKEISVVTRFDNDYPQSLFELHDPPSILFYRGVLPDVNQKSVTLVGTQSASNNGIELTTTIAKKLAEAKVQIISGLQAGVNTSVHLGASSFNGKTFTILESGLEKIHPEENRPVAIDIVQRGGLLSEYLEDVEYSKENSKTANRLLVAISQAVIITEFYKDDPFIYDLLESCSQIGKMVFVLVDPRYNLVDTDSLNHAMKCGAVPLVGLDKLEDIAKSLV